MSSSRPNVLASGDKPGRKPRDQQNTIPLRERPFGVFTRPGSTAAVSPSFYDFKSLSAVPRFRPCRRSTATMVLRATSGRGCQWIAGVARMRQTQPRASGSPSRCWSTAWWAHDSFPSAV